MFQKLDNNVKTISILLNDLMPLKITLFDSIDLVFHKSI